MQDIITSQLIMQPGIFVLRHPGNGLGPLSIARAPIGHQAAGRIETLSTPGTEGYLLRSDNDCIVMQILDAPVPLLVHAYRAQPDAVPPALRVDRIALGFAVSAPPATTKSNTLPPHKTTAETLLNEPAAPASAPITIAANGITVIGYVEHIGDQVAAEGEYLGSRDSLNRIEGFQIMWPDRPAGVDLSYGITIEGQARAPLVATGKFCGTRNKAKRIIEATFTLVGPDAQQYQLEGSACFSGGFRTPVQSGRVLTGPSGMEHLTALALCARPIANDSHGKARMPAHPPGKHQGKKK